MYEHADLTAVLEHRHPVLLVDRVLSCRPGSEIRAAKAVTGSEPCYAALRADGVGHAGRLDGAAYRYPPSLLLESLVQAAAVLWRLTVGAADGTLVLAGVREVTFQRPVFPGDTVHHVVHLERVIGSNAFCTGRTVLAAPEEPVVTTAAQLVLAMRPVAALRPA